MQSKTIEDHDGTSTSRIATTGSDEFLLLKNRAGKLDHKLKTLAGVGEAIYAIEKQQYITSTQTFQSAEIPRLDPSKKIKPIDNLDDLIFLYLSILEGASSADDTERLLDGLARLHNERPKDIRDRVSPLGRKLELDAEREISI